METVIKPELMLVKTVNAVNCRMTMIARLCRTAGWVVDGDRVGPVVWIAWSEDLVCRLWSSTGATSCDILQAPRQYLNTSV